MVVMELRFWYQGKLTFSCPCHEKDVGWGKTMGSEQEEIFPPSKLDIEPRCTRSPMAADSEQEDRTGGTSEMTRLLFATEQPLLGAGLEAVLSRCPECEARGVALTPEEWRKAIGEWRPQIAVIEWTGTGGWNPV